MNAPGAFAAMIAERYPRLARRYGYAAPDALPASAQPTIVEGACDGMEEMG